MRSHRLLALILALATPAVSGLFFDAHADFDPSGRSRGKPRPVNPVPGPRPGPRPAAAGRPAAPPRPGTTTPTDGETTGHGPGADALITRYTGIVLSQPSVPFPLQRLSQLYRERDGNLIKLIADFEKRASVTGPDGWAARVALAGIYRIEGRFDDAATAYQTVIAERASDPGPVQALAQLYFDRGLLAQARPLFEQALSLAKTQPDKEGLLRTLMKLALDLKDLAGARAYHAQVLRLAQGSLFVRAELGRELLQRGDYVEAEKEYRELVKASAGDNRTLAPALRDLGQVLVKQRKNQEAMEVLRRALAIAGREAGVRGEVYMIMTEAFRAENKLPELIVVLEAARQNDFQELATLGLLYEETGRVDKALEAYRKALQSEPRHIDTRLKVIHILQAQGELEAAIREYESLIRTVPNNPDFVFELCDTLIQRGDRAKALRLLTGLEGRVGNDDDQLARLSDFYERIEEHDRALKILQRLAGGAQDPQHVIDLGDRYFQQGDKKKALDTWARLRTIIPQRAKALATLGEVYLDHDMTKEALEALREAAALEPENVRYQKSLALSLERIAATTGSSRQLTPYHREAQKIWEEILAKAQAKGDSSQAREARMHVVTIWALARELPAQVAPLSNRFAATPPDTNAGWMLAEVLIRLQRLPDAETALVKLTGLMPGESELFLTLERVYVLEHKLEDAIATLKRLVQMDPKRARQYYQRMAQFAAELYRDDEAVGYAAEAVALAPDDADGHRKLGEMYRRRQDNEKAVSEFRAAITKNDRLYVVYFELAELLSAKGQSEEADSLYRRVVRGCPDEELVARAARLSMQVNLGRGTLENLERELLPVALGHPQKSIYRKLLVDLYGAMAFPLVQKVRFGSPEEAKEAREALARIGTRAVKPLLDALGEDNQSQRLIAIEVLAFVENRSAAPALFNFATGQAEQSLRLRAMVACGALRDPTLIPRFKSLLVPSKDSPALIGGPIATIAAWSLARMQDKRATTILMELAKSSSPELRALAILGLGAAQDKGSIKTIAEVVNSLDAGNVARAAAAYTLADLGAKSEADNLLSLARGSDAIPRAAALVAVARLVPDRAKDAVADAIFDRNPSLRKAAFAAAQVIAAQRAPKANDPFAVPDGPLSVRSLLDEMIPSGFTPKERAASLIALELPLTRSALDATRTSPERAMLIADALLARPNAPALAPFTDDIESAPESDRLATEEAVRRIAKALAPAFIALVRHPSIDLRIRAIRVLARQTDSQSNAAVVDGLSDENETVQRATLTVLSEMRSDAAVRALSNLLSHSDNWALRVRAAQALGTAPPSTSSEEARNALTEAARKDAFALVRQSAIESLFKISPQSAKATLQFVAKEDPEPRVKETARRLLGN